MENLWRIDCEVRSKVDGRTLDKKASEFYASRQEAEATILELDINNHETYPVAWVSHPTYGNFFLDPTMWNLIMTSRTYTF